MLQEIRFQDQVLNPCKSIQETSEEVMDFKTRQLVSIKVYKATEARCSIASSTYNIYRGSKGNFYPILDSCSINTLSIEIYENQIFNFDFTPIRVYLFRLSFHKHIVIGDICPNSSLSSRSCCVCTQQSFVTKEFCDLHRVNELKNFVTNIFLKLVIKSRTGIRVIGQSLYWESCIEKESLPLSNKSNWVLE